MESAPAAAETRESRLSDLALQTVQHAPADAAKLLAPLPDGDVAEVLQAVNPSVAQDILLEMDEDRRRAVTAAAPAAEGRQWSRNQTYPEGAVGRLMEAPYALFRPEQTVESTVEKLRELVKTAFVTYVFVTDARGVLSGVVTMRDLLLAEKSATLDSLMLRNPFSLRPDIDLLEAMKLVVNRHFPVYPVCDEAGILVGIVRGRTLFEEQAFEISAQAGTMVGVEKEERLSTPWSRSLRFRHPWLQLNLLTAFVAAAVVGTFAETIDKVVVLAAFLPVLAGQSGNTGCQALAVMLRGLTLGEMKPGRERRLVMKEGLLGFLNGALVGVIAGLAMFFYARRAEHPEAALLGFVVFLAMIGSCTVSGVSGAMIPLVLKRAGADPATASSIFLTTATDVASMGMFLALATWLVL